MPTPAASGSTEAGAPSGILIGAETTDIVDEGGRVLLSLRYSEDGDVAVAKATEVLGTPQNEKHQEGTLHRPPMDGTSWGGFDIVVLRYSDKLQPQGEDRLYMPAFTVQATTASTTSGIQITAVDKTAVGDSFDAVSAGKPAVEVHFDSAFGVRSMVLELPTSFPGIFDAGVEMAYGAIGWSDKDSESVTRITAPAPLYSQS